MAEAQPNPLRLGGYNDEFVEEIEEDWLCPICTLPLKEAVQTRRCGHRLCKACIDAHFASQGADKQSFCPACRTNLDREQDIFEDLAADRKIRSFTIKCPSRSRGCQWTGELRAKDAHHEVCPKVPVTCPQKCGMKILREKVADHKENQCALVEISCPYSKLGCPEKFQRKEKTSHLQSCMQVHLDLACVKLNDTEEELRTTREKLEQRMSALENRPGPYYNVYTWKIGGFEEILRQAKTGGEDRIESDPFYTGECGYKFKMRLFPNGHGKGENTHLSLFLVNIKGEYDAILQWPFPKKAMLILIDQQENLNDRQSVSYTLTRAEVIWKSRPVERKDANWGWLRFLSHDELQRRAYIVDDTIFIQAKFE
ncbi:PREDICTED: TNF receptor-associated factor 4-like isoform X2 [Acropora digitifera]|uniref:TNF receptor-associated factor 4-like isoform X2 n=1 Tax=Acropora digitifera TaxID=70779 RepID=UPI00077ACA16|nr:PREDICTED: TNF receptor-associated factor 4-like isoform X2 [Acropora digitifera]